jgi:pimeloyl-ACP methyl ester carboxylesterase
VLLILSGLVALFYLVVLPALITHWLTRGRYHFRDANDGKTPQSFGLDFQWVQFRSLDGTMLRGWYVPAVGDEGGTIIYCHGLNRTRIEMLSQAAFAHGLGYNGLLFDFRHSGQSGGELTTLGYQERQDVIAAARYVLKQQKAKRPVVAWGVSMGAAAALLAAAEYREIDAVIADSSFLSLRETVAHHLKLFRHLPAFPLADALVFGLAWRGGYWPSEFDLVKATERLGNRPVLFVAVEGDRRMPPAIARTLHAHSPSPKKQIIVLPGERHGEGFRSAPDQYRQAVIQFLKNL